MYVITSAPIEYAFKGYDIYDSFDLVSQGIEHAPLSENATEVMKQTAFPFNGESIKTIYTAPEGQTYETARLFITAGISPHARIKTTPLLEGVRFSMQELISKEEFLSLPYEIALQKARTTFIRKLIKNQLPESFISVRNRIEMLIASLSKEQDAIAISHGFFMKLLYVYISKPEAFDTPTLLESAFSPGEVPYGRLEGFVLPPRT